jgi:hypothetical protein
MKRNFEKLCELEDRSCDALVLAYNPSEALGSAYDGPFYIPSCSEVEEAFGYSLRKIFGPKQGCTHWADSIKWDLVAGLNKLEKRIREGVGEATGGDRNYMTFFQMYLSMNFNPRFQSPWIYMTGDLYRFSKGKREETLEKFENFWNEKEKSRWIVIHDFMREYTAKQYKDKKR